MRVLRMKRKDIERSFLQQINGLFQQLPDPRSTFNRPLHDQASNLDSLSLVGNDDLEMDVAIEGMSSKAKSAFADSIYQLNMRLDVLMVSVTVADRHNPLHPRHVCDAFKKARSEEH